jgi:hypothetical protein
MLLVAATMAMVPNTVASVPWLAWLAPTSVIAPSTAMASSALVSDINGVCSNGDTLRITSSPMNAANAKMKSPEIRSLILVIWSPTPAAKRTGARGR